MEKGSTITFITIVASIIVFSIFISAFPNGIKISKPVEIFYEGKNIKFYGKIEGKGEVKIFAYNSSATLNNKSFYGDFILNGSINFSSPSAIFVKEKIFTSYVSISGENCWINNEFYKKIEGNILGNLSIELKGDILMKESKEENKNILPLDFSRIFPIKFNKIFFINGSGVAKINGIDKNFTKYILFRGGGKYSGSKLNASCYLLAIDGKFYDKEEKIFFIPVKILLLWLAAVALFIISSFLKKDAKDKQFSGFSIIIAILFFAIFFFLWNCEMEKMFGFNLFDIRNITIANILFISLAIVPYLVAIGIIGFPTRIAISSIFEIVGLTNIGKGIGRSVGLMLTTFWGISLINSLLNLTLSPLLRLI